MQNNVSFYDIQKGVYSRFLSKTPWQNEACNVTDTFLHVHLKGLNLTFTPPQVNELHHHKIHENKTHPNWEKKE